MIEDGKLFGLGSNDAGAALVSLLAAFLYFYSKENLDQNKILYKDLHIKRVITTYGYFHCLVNAKKIIEIYDQIEKTTNDDCRVRIEFSIAADFETAITKSPFQKNAEPIHLLPALFNQQASGLGLGNFKTTDRHYWDQNLKTMTNYISSTSVAVNITDVDVLGVNDQGIVTESSRFNLFVLDGSTFFTPTLTSGCLQGVFRQNALDSGGISFQGALIPLIERDFMLADLKTRQLFLGNSVQGLLSALLI